MFLRRMHVKGAIWLRKAGLGAWTSIYPSEGLNGLIGPKNAL